MKKPYEIRPLAPDEFDAWQATLGSAFGFDPRPEDNEFWRKAAEFGRYLAAWDGGQVVGTGGAFSLTMTVPGGARLPFGGITAIATRPTHRRTGVLTAMMRQLLAQGRERGEAISALWAAESMIYQRFGFGVAIEGCELQIERPYARLTDNRPPSGRLSMLSPDEARSVFPRLYASAVERIPGSVVRGERGWDLYFNDPESWRDGSTSYRHVLYERAGRPRGYVTYRQKEDWLGNLPHSEVRIAELQATDGDAYRALWRYCFGIDLVHLVKAHARRLREPLLLILEDPRRLQQLRSDHIWLRLVDVPAALAARRYSVEGEVVLEVVDSFEPSCGGRFRLAGGPDGAQCTPTRRAAQVTLAAADLASAYLGDAQIASLAWLGRVEGKPGPVARLQAMMHWPVAPWCAVHF